MLLESILPKKQHWTWIRWFCTIAFLLGGLSSLPPLTTTVISLSQLGESSPLAVYKYLTLLGVGVFYFGLSFKLPYRIIIPGFPLLLGISIAASIPLAHDGFLRIINLLLHAWEPTGIIFLFTVANRFMSLSEVKRYYPALFILMNFFYTIGTLSGNSFVFLDLVLSQKFFLGLLIGSSIFIFLGFAYYRMLSSPIEKDDKEKSAPTFPLHMLIYLFLFLLLSLAATKAWGLNIKPLFKFLNLTEYSAYMGKVSLISTTSAMIVSFIALLIAPFLQWRSFVLLWGAISLFGGIFFILNPLQPPSFIDLETLTSTGWSPWYLFFTIKGVGASVLLYLIKEPIYMLMSVDLRTRFKLPLELTAITLAPALVAVWNTLTLTFGGDLLFMSCILTIVAVIIGTSLMMLVYKNTKLS